MPRMKERSKSRCLRRSKRRSRCLRRSKPIKYFPKRKSPSKRRSRSCRRGRRVRNPDGCDGTQYSRRDGCGKD